MTMYKLFVVAVIIACSLCGFTEMVAAKSDLARTQQSIKEAKARKQSLDKENDIVSKELLSLQRQLVKAAAKVQKKEAELSYAEKKLRIMKKKLKEKQATLLLHKKKLASLVRASIKLSRTPEEAIILMPGDSAKTMKTARALKMTSQSIKHETNIIHAQMQELEVLKTKMAKQRDSLFAKKKKLVKQQKALSAQVAERRALQAKLGKDLRAQAAKIAKYARKAKNIKGLLSNILQKRRDRARGKLVQMPSAKPKGVRGKIRSFKAAKGKIRPPLAGVIVQKYGSVNKKKEIQHGITILAREQSRVTSPYDGEVVYAGVFLKYGRVVIIRHSDNFHTVLSGISQIDTSAGEFLLEGEPIGAMGEGDSSARLYLELRKKNQPINPMPWLNNI